MHDNEEKPVPVQVEFMKEREAYSDAELYRLFVARQLIDGRCENKAECDAMIRRLGDLAAADQVIALRDKPPVKN